MPDVCFSVIIPAYNASKTIERAINAVLAQSFSKTFEIIVVDDGSTDDTSFIIKRFPAVRYQYQPNAGPAAARNHGARLAKGEYLAFTDADCAPHVDWLSQLHQGFQQTNVGVVCGSYGIANPTSRLARCVHQEILFRHKYLMPDFPKAFGGYNFCTKRSVFEAVGGFNEIYRNASGEDNDLSYKIIQSGVKIYFNRDALVDHVHPTRVLRYLKEQYRHGYWRVKMYADHPNMAKGDDYTFWKDVIEVPWAGICFGLFVVSCFSGLSFIQGLLVLWLAFLIFEWVWGCVMIREMFDGIFFGFVIFFRAFARCAGFSTGILNYFFKKK